MSTRMRLTLLRGKAGKSWACYVDYSVDDLVAHIESKFMPGMSWDNMGEWHIDHIKPVAAFDFSSPEDAGFKLCWALDNLQPLWASDNIMKGAKY